MKAVNMVLEEMVEEAERLRRKAERYGGGTGESARVYRERASTLEEYAEMLKDAIEEDA